MNRLMIIYTSIDLFKIAQELIKGIEQNLLHGYMLYFQLGCSRNALKEMFSQMIRFC